MATSARLCHFLTSFASILVVCIGLYQDQAGTFDWRQKYVGGVKFLSWDESRQTGKRVFVGTEQNVVALINIQTGDLVWRRVMEEEGDMDALLHHSNSLITLSSGGSVMRSWNPGSGLLLWEQHLTTDPKADVSRMIWATNSKDKVAVLSADTLSVYHMANGRHMWSAPLPSSEQVAYRYIVSQDGDIAVVGVSPNSHVSVLRYNIDGESELQRTIPAPWINADTQCTTIRDQDIVCYDPTTNTLYLASIQDSVSFTPVSLQELRLPESTELTFIPGEQFDLNDGHFVAKLSTTHCAVLKVAGQSIVLVKDLPEYTSVWMGNAEDTSVILAGKRHSPQTVELTAFDVTTGGELVEFSHNLNVADFHGHLSMISPLFFKKRDGRNTYRAIVTFSDLSIQMIQSTGKIGWRREEALAYLVSVEMVDLPVSENEAKFEDEFGSSEADVIAMFLKRIRTQISQLKTVLTTWIQKLAGHRAHSHSSHASPEFVETEENELTRDQFSVHKMMVLVASSGKIFGMLSASGKIVWQILLPELSPFDHSGKPTLPLFLQRSSAHFPNPPQCAVLGKHKETGRGILYIFNPITGEVTPDTPVNGYDLPYRPTQAVMSHVTDDHFLKGIVIMDDQAQLYTYPTSHADMLAKYAPNIYLYHFAAIHIPYQPRRFTSQLYTYPASHADLLAKYAPNMYLYNADVTTGIITGHRISSKDDVLSAQETWSINLGRGQQVITNIVSKRSIEHVHSQGRVLGDRSVLYKYLNPNLVAVTTEGEDHSPAAASSQKGPNKFVGVYLIDSITGRIVFQATHKRVSGPVHLVHSENWVVYNYYNQKWRRGEVAVLELYEGKNQANSTVFSAFHASHTPLVMGHTPNSH